MAQKAHSHAGGVIAELHYASGTANPPCVCVVDGAEVEHQQAASLELGSSQGEEVEEVLAGLGIQGTQLLREGLAGTVTLATTASAAARGEAGQSKVHAQSQRLPKAAWLASSHTTNAGTRLPQL